MNMSTLTRSVSYSLLFLMTVVLVGCQDLSVENTNNPTTEQVLSTAEDVEGLAGNTFRDFWSGTQWCDPSMLYSTLADAHSCSWANWAMNDMSSEPRITWNNSSAYSRALVTEAPWFRNYLAISNASDVLRSIENIGADQINTTLGSDVAAQRMEAFANFVLGLSYGHIASTFDRGFLVDETTNLEDPAGLELVPYDQVKDFAIQKLDNAIAIAEANDFTIAAGDDWIFGLDVSSDRLIRLANSYKARYEASVTRTPAERAAADWGSIQTWIDNGITETFAPIGDDDGSSEWDCMKFYGQEPSTWARADYRTIGPADQSGGYEDWVATPVADRNPYETETVDQRIQSAGVGSDGSDASFQGTAFTAFPPARGTYHYSDYTFDRYGDYLANTANGAMPVMRVAEMDLLKAEALLQTGGDPAEVADLINNTRVDRGGMSAAAGTDPVGSIDDAPNPLAPGDVTLWSMLKYEFNLETMLTAAGINYFTDRGWGDLVEGTPLHFPIPGAELETLGTDTYTFGGVGGRCAAPAPGGNFPSEEDCLGGSGGGGGSSLRLAEQFVINLDRWQERETTREVSLPSSPQ